VATEPREHEIWGSSQPHFRALRFVFARGAVDLDLLRVLHAFSLPQMGHPDPFDVRFATSACHS
jgi:hypothetical protein